MLVARRDASVREVRRGTRPAADDCGRASESASYVIKITVATPVRVDGGAAIPAQLACRPGEPVVAVALSIGMFCGSRVHGMLAGRERQRGKEVARAIFGIILANKCTTVLRLLPVCRVRVDERPFAVSHQRKFLLKQLLHQ